MTGMGWITRNDARLLKSLRIATSEEDIIPDFFTPVVRPPLRPGQERPRTPEPPRKKDEGEIE